MVYYGRNKKKYNLTSSPFAQGGEGKIYDVIGENGFVAKLYKDISNSSDKEKKLLAMASKPLDGDNLHHVAWPVDVLYDSNRRFVGFIMPRLEKCDELNVIYEYGPTSKYPNISWDNKITMAKNLCAILDAVHELGYVVGDLNPKNISVNPSTGHVYFFDVDSFQVTENGRVHRCMVGMPEYLAPEIHKKLKAERGKKLGELSLPTFTKETDNFALALHIFQLLMNGTHPFACRVLPSQSSVVQPQPSDNILKGVFPFMQPQAGTDIPIYAPPITIFPKEIQNLFRKAFIDGYSSPQVRPTALMWHTALGSLERELSKCLKVVYHKYYKQLTQCPWCEADKKFQKVMVGGSAPKPSPRPYVPPRVTPPVTPHVYRHRTRRPAAKTFAILLPILAFIAGQIMQYVIYAPEQSVWIESAIFGNIPLLFMVISTISCAVCISMVCFNSWKLIDNNKIAGGWVFNIVSDILFLLIPCFTGSLGVLIYPIVTIVLTDKIYGDEDETTKVFSVVTPILLYVIGQIFQYYIYIVGNSRLLIAPFLAQVPLWLQILSTIGGAVATGLSCYCGWKKADDSDIGHSCAITYISSLCFGILPVVFGLPAIIVMGIMAHQINSGSEEYVPIAPTIVSFIVGQIILYCGFVKYGEIAILTGLIEISEATSFNALAFVIVTSILGAVATGFASYLGYHFVDNNDVGSAYFLLIPFNLLMVFTPTISSILLFVIAITVFCCKNINKVRALIIVLLALTLVATGVMWIVDAAIDTTPYTVKLDAQGGIGGTTEISVIYKREMPEAVAPQKEGYNFVGYYDEVDSGNQYYNSNMDSVARWNKKDGGTLYAHWSAKSYNITFDKDGGSGGSDSVQVVYGQPMPSAKAPTKNGYSFRGYYLGYTQYYSSSMQSVQNWDRASDSTLKAQWSSTLSVYASSYNISNLSGSTTITLSATGGSGNYTYRVTNYPSGINYSISGNTLTVSKKDNDASGTIRISVTDNTYGTSDSCSISYTTSSCLAAGTLIMMADGSTKKIEDVKCGDVILSWSFITGRIEAMPVSLFWNHGLANYRVINLQFSNACVVRVISTHGFFDRTLNKFVYITEENYFDYVGHCFAYLNDFGELSDIVLIGAEITEEYIGCYSLRTACNDNAITAGLLSLTWEDYPGMLTYFEIGENMKYDEEKMMADIQTYGLYTYEEWSEYVSYEEFVALNGQYFKILIGKGILTIENIFDLIQGLQNEKN